MTRLTLAVLSGVVSLASLTCAGSLSAQGYDDIQVGSKIPVRPAKADPILDGIVRDNYVRCTYGPYRDQIDALLATSDPLQADFDAAGIDIAQLTRRHTLRACFVSEGEVVNSSITFSPTSFRYMMLEAAYRNAFDAVPADHADHVGAPRRFVSTGERLALAQSLGAFADCLANNDPVGSDRLLRTRSGTPAEKEAAMALVPALGKCIVAGQQLQLTQANIRTFAADGMWQRFLAPKPEAS